MKVKNIVFPLLLCAVMTGVLIYVPERLSAVYDQSMMGKFATEDVEEPLFLEPPVQDSIRLLWQYGTNADILCIRDNDFGSYLWEEGEGIVIRTRQNQPSQPSQELLSCVQRELTELKEQSLLPEILLEEADIEAFVFEQYMDMQDENQYVSGVALDFETGDVWAEVWYSIENEKILRYRYEGNEIATDDFEKEESVLDGWSRYLGIGQTEVETYYTYTIEESGDRAGFGMELEL